VERGYIFHNRTIAVVAALSALLAGPACAQDAQAAQDLARAAKNPFANMVSVPLTYDANFGGGLGSKTQQVFNTQPLIPFSLNADWSLIARPMIPFTTQPGLAPGQGGASGLGDIQLATFITPARTGKLVWGAGPVFLLPSATSQALGQGKWAAGPTAAALWFGEQWTFGALINNVWSFAGERDRTAVNQMQLQPQINYNFRDNPDRFVSFSPTITANWKASGSERWTVPVSLGIGQLVKFGSQPVNLQATAYYNAIKPAEAATWTLEFQAQFLFPK
jgi:hypothetical protein